MPRLHVNRQEVVAKLVGGGRLTAKDREALGGFVRRQEIVDAIERLLGTYGQFPIDTKVNSGWQLVAVPDGVHLVSHRIAKHAIRSFPDVREGIEQYVRHEIGPSLGGIRIR